MEQARLSVSDPGESRSLRDWLRRVPGVAIRQTPVPPGPGEQGASDVLTVLAESAGVLTVAIRSLPDFIRSRRSDVTVTVTAGDKTFQLSAANVAEVMPLVEKALEASGDYG